MGAPLMAFVSDNSVIVAWLIPDQANDYTRRMDRRAAREQPVVPALWEPEFANVITVLVRRGVLARHHADAILSRVERLQLAVDRAAVLPRALFELADRHGISAYDAAYLELAQRRGLPLATRDTRLARVARAAGMLLR
ncbi:MAG: type II toxin-antitoxin system VapC family toxin [Betaproteobacteria bacterium]|nr:type II toxin-antitoxin system VapC family toxin [Betaproteobacteria bacterium]